MNALWSEGGSLEAAESKQNNTILFGNKSYAEISFSKKNYIRFSKRLCVVVRFKYIGLGIRVTTFLVFPRPSLDVIYVTSNYNVGDNSSLQVLTVVHMIIMHVCAYT